MGAHSVARRLCVLVLVAAAHLSALLLIATLTRSQRLHVSAEADALLVVLLPPEPPRFPQRTPRQPFPVTNSSRTPPATAVPAAGKAPATATATNAITIDWAAEATRSARLQAEEDELARRRAAALAAPHDPAFDQAPRPPEFHWDPVHANRVVPLAGGGTLVRLNDNCALIISVVIPLVGCTLGKIPARGDLFEHMRDAPEFGAWKDR
jgi:hypothetical protein